MSAVGCGDDTLYEPPVTAPAGKTFIGWDPAVAFGTVSGVTGTKTIRVDAKFEDGYHVTFLTTDGSVLCTVTVAPNGTLTDLPDEVKNYQPAGKRVTAWKSDNGEFTTSTVVTGDITLTPDCVDCYWVTFDTQGGSGVASQYVDQGNTLTLANVTDPTRTGYTFKGWSLTQNGETVASVIPSADTTLYAVWEASGVKYTVAYWGENANDEPSWVMRKNTPRQAREFPAVPHCPPVSRTEAISPIKTVTPPPSKRTAAPSSMSAAPATSTRSRLTWVVVAATP